MNISIYFGFHFLYPNHLSLSMVGWSIMEPFMDISCSQLKRNTWIRAVTIKPNIAYNCLHEKSSPDENVSHLHQRHKRG